MRHKVPLWRHISSGPAQLNEFINDVVSSEVDQFENNPNLFRVLKSETVDVELEKALSKVGERATRYRNSINH